MSISWNKEYVDISQYSSIHVGGSVKAIHSITSHEHAVECILAIRIREGLNMYIIPIGGGTNTFFDKECNAVHVLLNTIKGINVRGQNDSTVLLTIGSGEVWDNVVEFAVNNSYQGIEALSAIPGTAGGAVVQNAGAYGGEMKDVVVSVQAINLDSGEEKIFSHEECNFSYRKSCFKTMPSQWFITSFVIKLHKVPVGSIVPIPEYDAVKKYCEEKKLYDVTLSDVRNIITEIRWSKLPRPDVIPNCGSWFTNPIVSNEVGEALLARFSAMSHWILPDGSYKCSAGWLIDHVFGKGYSHNGFKLYEKNALVITNPKSINDINSFLSFEHHIKEAVFEMFGVMLEREPVFIEAPSQ